MSHSFVASALGGCSMSSSEIMNELRSSQGGGSKAKQCKYCSKSYSSNFNCSRHEKTMHPQKFSLGGQGIKMSGDPESSSDDGTNEVQWGHWEKLIKQTIDEMENETMPKDAKHLLQEPHFSIFVEKMRENLEDYMTFAQYMKDDDPIFAKIQKTADIYEDDKNMEEAEAFEKAWNDRKILLKRFLRDHIDDIEDLIDKDEDEDQEETDNEDDDDEMETDEENLESEEKNDETSEQNSGNVTEEEEEDQSTE